MALNGCMATLEPSMTMLVHYKATCGRSVQCLSHRPAYLSARNWCRAPQVPRHPSLCAGAHTEALSSVASPLLRGGHVGSLADSAMPFLSPRRGKTFQGNHKIPRASKYNPFRLNNYPAMTEKPRWWWRTLASIPYLIPLHATWTCAETAFHISPFLEELEFFVDSFNWYVASFPSWFWMAYSMALYLGVVRRRQWPHFLRFHVANAMLLENLLEIAYIVCGWVPLTVFRSKAGLHFWTAVAVAYLFTVIECIHCGLCGAYADVPFVSESAYMQCDYFDR